MSQKELVVLIGGMLAPAWAMDPPGEILPPPPLQKGKIQGPIPQSLDRGYAADSMAEAPCPSEDLFQRKRIPDGFFPPKGAQSAGRKCIREGPSTGDKNNPLSAETPPRAIGINKTPGGPYLWLELVEDLLPEARRRIGKLCKQSTKHRIGGDIKDFTCYLPVGAKVERAKVFLKLYETLELIEQNPTSPQAKTALEAERKINYRALKKIKNLAVENLEILIGVDKAEVTQKILEWVMKNPYGIKTLSIRTLGEQRKYGKRSLGLLPRSPIGKKFYKQKKLQDISIEGKINPAIINLIEKYTDVRRLCLNEGLNSFSKKSLKTLTQSSLSCLKALAVQSDHSILEKIQKAVWAKNLTSLHLEAYCYTENKILSGFSWSFFPAVDKLTLSHLWGEARPINSLLENAPSLHSFHAYQCCFCLSSFSAFLQKLSEKTVELKLERITLIKSKDWSDFYQLPLRAAENLRALTLKLCVARGKRLEHFFGASDSFALHFLDLSHNMIGIEEFKTVFSKRFLDLKELNISGNHLGADSVLFLARNYKNFPNFEKLILSKRFFDPLYATEPKGPSETECQEEFRRIFPKAKILYTND